ncbi:uncharacterized protein [Solanum lycopersicum]|uniref:uncharacterized protein n=1 Tax=Solanum lycopersicum TaxID=4081 RepID=UPI003749AEE1
MTKLCLKVEKIEVEVKEVKANGQQHDQKHAELRRTADGKQPEIEGDDGKLRKTHNNVCSDTAAGTSKRTSEKPKNTNLNQLFAKPFTQKPQMQISAEPQTSTYATTSQEKDMMKDLLAMMTNLCLKVEKIEVEVKEVKANGQQHDQKHAKLRRTADGKQPEIEGDDGKLRKTNNNVCSDTAAAPAEILYEEIKSPIQVVNIGLTKDMIISEEIEKQNEIPKVEIPDFYANIQTSKAPNATEKTM